MTRSYIASRKPGTFAYVPRRHASVTPLSFKCFRLVSIVDPDPGEDPYTSIELCEVPRGMSALRR